MREERWRLVAVVVNWAEDAAVVLVNLRAGVIAVDGDVDQAPWLRGFDDRLEDG
jgi:hypothetical protein